MVDLKRFSESDVLGIRNDVLAGIILTLIVGAGALITVRFDGSSSTDASSATESTSVDESTQPDQSADTTVPTTVDTQDSSSAGSETQASPSDTEPPVAAPTVTSSTVVESPVTTIKQETFVYSFENGLQGWSPDMKECPTAPLRKVDDVSFEEAPALAWSPRPAPGRTCTIGVAVKQTPPPGLDPQSFDWTYTRVGCHVRVPPEMRDGSLGQSDVQLVVPWVLNDEHFGDYFGSDFVFGPSSEEWEFLVIIPGNDGYTKFDGTPADKGQQDPFGELFSMKLRVQTNEEITLSEPIYVSKCEITTGFPRD